MNETLKTILNRRSIRAYKGEQIRDEELQSILEAGKYAPSAINQQTWHFTVIQNRELLQRLDNACKTAFKNSGNKNFEEMAKGESLIYKAPTLVIVSEDPKAILPVNDGCLALENMFLAAESLGIGSCWINAFGYLFSTDEGKALRKEIGVPEGYIIVGSGIFGYKGMDNPAPAPRKEGTVNIIK